MKKIAVVTATRAEYGILTPLLRTLQDDRDLELMLLVTGTHLSEKHGYTVQTILEDKFLVFRKIPILGEGNTPYDISITMAAAIEGFALCFHECKPDMLVILGDRTEMLGVACAAINERIPIAHIHGGEVTAGAVDDCIRHALTKMSYLHFTAADTYRDRVVQLGEAPERVFNVGSLSTENILRAPLLSESLLRSEIGIRPDIPYVVVTFHPVTLEDSSCRAQVLELCKAMEQRRNFFYLLTKANADAGGDAVNLALEEFCRTHGGAKLVNSLGMIRYLSALKYASFVLGNSSSGISEAPVLGTPSVNIGDRQKGRLMAETVIGCSPSCDAILEAMDKAAVMPHRPTRMYGDGDTSKKILSVLKMFLFEKKMDIKKGFYDMEDVVKK